MCELSPSAAVPVNGAGYYCTDASGSDFPSRTTPESPSIDPSASDKVASGLTRGNLRVVLTLDYAATPNLLVGGRLGYVFNAYPGQAAKVEGKAFAPIHAELRATYVLGREPLGSSGPAPYGMVAAGVSQWSAQVPVTVLTLAPARQPRSVEAWDIGGPGFVALGAGLRHAFTPSFALLTGPRLNVAFGTNATLLSVGYELGLQYGF